MLRDLKTGKYEGFMLRIIRMQYWESWDGRFGKLSVKIEEFEGFRIEFE